MAHPHLELRGRVYAYRRKIPLDLLDVYQGSREIRHSLRTRDKAEAVRLARLRSVELDDEFARQRHRHTRRRPQAPAITPMELTEENIRRVCLLWTRAVLETDDLNRSSTPLSCNSNGWCAPKPAKWSTRATLQPIDLCRLPSG